MVKFSYISQLFADEHTADEFCNFESVAASAVAGKDVLVCIYDANLENLLAIAGQNSLDLARSAETIDVQAKSLEDSGWGASLQGGKTWSIDLDALYVQGDDSYKAIAQAFEDGSFLCVKVVNKKQRKSMFAGLAIVTTLDASAPYDDAMTISVSLQGVGKLTDFQIEDIDDGVMPA